MCSQCRRIFVSKDALYQHCFDKSDHHYCDDCERLFITDEVLQKVCNPASQLLIYSRRTQHRAIAHQSDSESDTESEQSEGSEEDNDPDCVSCKRTFVCKQALYQHLIASSAHHWCFRCWKDFSSAQSLSDVRVSTYYTRNRADLLPTMTAQEVGHSRRLTDHCLRRRHARES